MYPSLFPLATVVRPRASFPSEKTRPAFTLVELLTVIAVIGILMALLLPAIQQARETARRVQCGSGLRQLGMACNLFEGVYRRFPEGVKTPSDASLKADGERLYWSGRILPFIEQRALWESLETEKSWKIPGSPNCLALQTKLSLFRCPSALAPEKIDHGVADRVPSTYLACVSGLVSRESSQVNQWEIQGTVSDVELDGMFFVDSQVRHCDILDGTSSTILVGEALYLENTSGMDYYSDQLVDHWAIGSPECNNREVSEALGTTAAPINAWRNKEPPFIEDLELGFSSRHLGGTQVVFADGHLQFVEQEIDPQVWSAMGTRMNGD